MRKSPRIHPDRAARRARDHRRARRHRLFRSPDRCIAKSREAACLNNLRSLGVGLESYLQDHNQIMPDLADRPRVENRRCPGARNRAAALSRISDAFHCPPIKEFEKSGCSYIWNNTQSGRHISKLVLLRHQGPPGQDPADHRQGILASRRHQFPLRRPHSSNKARFAAGN